MELKEPVREKTNILGSDQVRLKPAYTVIEDGLKLGILDISGREIVLSMKRLPVTAKLMCAIVFAYADCWFSHAAA